MRYLVTLELKTPLWKRVLRWFRLIEKRKEFLVELSFTLKAGDLLYGGEATVLVIRKVRFMKFGKKKNK